MSSFKIIQLFHFVNCRCICIYWHYTFLFYSSPTPLPKSQLRYEYICRFCILCNWNSICDKPFWCLVALEFQVTSFVSRPEIIKRLVKTWSFYHVICDQKIPGCVDIFGRGTKSKDYCYHYIIEKCTYWSSFSIL